MIVHRDRKQCSAAHQSSESAAELMRPAVEIISSELVDRDKDEKPRSTLLNGRYFVQLRGPCSTTGHTRQKSSAEQPTDSRPPYRQR